MTKYEKALREIVKWEIPRDHRGRTLWTDEDHVEFLQNIAKKALEDDV